MSSSTPDLVFFTRCIYLSFLSTYLLVVQYSFSHLIYKMYLLVFSKYIFTCCAEHSKTEAGSSHSRWPTGDFQSYGTCGGVRFLYYYVNVIFYNNYILSLEITFTTQIKSIVKIRVTWTRPVKSRDCSFPAASRTI